MALEINLVPDVKHEMIRTLKFRNLVFFICIVVAAASLGATAILGSIAGAQQASADGKKDTITLMSSKVKSYDDLSDFLTVRDQLTNISSISNNKKLLSRVFGVLNSLLPTGSDTITLSELSINFTGDEPTLTFDAQANAGDEPYIDYNVLDAFKKSMQYMRYDYGNYVDRYGETIPSYCIIESGDDGATFYDSDRGYYALWQISEENCNPSLDTILAEIEEEEALQAEAESYNNYDEEDLDDEDENNNETDSENNENNDENNEEEEITEIYGYSVEDYDGEKVVRIWRTPQFSDWYKTAETYEEGEAYMDLTGEISNVAHFESECISYYGIEDDEGNVTWGSTNTECLTVPDGTDGIVISDSSNGRGADDELVLRFSATITLNSEVFDYNNKHMLAIAPSGRHNVTDSYVQIQSMFAERAADCTANDTACNNTSTGGTN